MCNVCNSNFGTNTTSGYNCGGWLSSPFALANSGCCQNACCMTQSVCRDANGCLRIRNASNGCCGCCNHCCCGNGNGNSANANNGNGSTNANGGFVCYTVCGTHGGSATTSTATIDGDAYYARQYGLCPYGVNRSCGCGCNA